MKLYLIIFLLGISSVLKAQDRFAISGVVRDDENKTLPGATVFITGTKIITACDNDGRFHFDNIAAGSYEVIVKMIGFTPLTVPVTLTDHSVSLNLSMKVNSSMLGEVVIRSKEPNWDANFREFKRYFLGTTPNAQKCVITNAKILHFHLNKETNVLTARANDFLVIQNNALGYKINYLLKGFEINETTKVLRYEGYPSFQEMEPKDDKELFTWTRNRLIAYHGSVTNFMKAIYDGDTYKQGFEVFKISNKPPPGVKIAKDTAVVFDEHPIMFDSLLTITGKNFKQLKYHECLYVVYIKEQPAYAIKGSGYEVAKPSEARIPVGQNSMVNLMDSSGVTIDSNGNFSQPGALLFEGYMGWEQIADLTPLEFAKGKD